MFVEPIGFHIFGMLAFLLFWGGVIVLAIWAIRSFAMRPPYPPQPMGPPPGPPPTPLEILQRRLAAGEITPEEYKKIRSALEA